MRQQRLGRARLHLSEARLTSTAYIGLNISEIEFIRTLNAPGNCRLGREALLGMSVLVF